LLGSAVGGEDRLAAIHGERLERLLERLVETPVRGFVYEASGGVDPLLLRGGAAAVRTAGERWRIPVAIVEADPAQPTAWADSMADATLGLIGSRRRFNAPRRPAD
jgi:hypothetical protein